MYYPVKKCIHTIAFEHVCRYVEKPSTPIRVSIHLQQFYSFFFLISQFLRKSCTSSSDLQNTNCFATGCFHKFIKCFFNASRAAIPGQSLPALSPVNQIQPAYRLATRLLRTVPVGNLIWLLLLLRAFKESIFKESFRILSCSPSFLRQIFLQTGIFHLPFHKDTFPEEELLLPPTKLFQDDSFLSKAISTDVKESKFCVLQTECSALHRTTKYAD